MKHFRYRLIDFLSEEVLDKQDTKQFYDGDSDTGEQAGKPNTEESQGDYNLKQIANSIAAAVKSHTAVKAKLDPKNLKASGKLKVKAGENVKISGEAELDFRTGKADVAIPIKIKDKEVNLNILGLNVANPKDMYGKEIKGSFIDPESNKEITVGVNLDPKKDNYSFRTGRKGETASIGIEIKIDKSNVAAGANVGFNAQDFIPSKFAPKVNVGVEYDNSGGLSSNITAKKDFKTRTGTVGVSATGTAGGGERSVGVGVSFMPDKKKKGPEDKVGKIASKGMRTATGYVDIKSGSGLKMVKDREGKKVTKVSKKVGDIKKDVQGATKTVQKAADLKESTVKITKKDLSSLIEKLLN